MNADLITLIHRVGVRKVAQTLGLARDTVMSLAVGIAHPGTLARFEAAESQQKLANLRAAAEQLREA